MTAKNGGSDANHQCKQKISTQNNKRDTRLYTLLQLCASTGIQYRFIFSMLMDNIRVMYVVDENILQNSAIGKKMIWCLALISKKIALQKTDG